MANDNIKIIDYLDNVELARQRFIAALDRKENPVPSTSSLNVIADAIDQLPKKLWPEGISGLEIPVDDQGRYLVRWVDADGTVLKREYIAKGDSATPPVANYDSEYLEFATWSSTSDYTNVQYPVDNGAVYNTKEDEQGRRWTIIKTFIPENNFTAQICESTTLQSYQDRTRQVYIDWGDGSEIEEIEYTDNTLNLHTHTYLNKGNYVIRFYSTKIYYFYNGYNGSSYDCNFDPYITAIYFGDNIHVSSSQHRCPGLEYADVISFGMFFTGSNYLYFNPRGPKTCIIIPPNHTAISQVFRGSTGVGSSLNLYKELYIYIVPNTFTSTSFTLYGFQDYGFGFLPYFVIPDNYKVLNNLNYCSANTLICPPGMTTPEVLDNTFANNCYTQYILNCPTINITSIDNRFNNCNGLLNMPVVISDSLTNINTTNYWLPQNITSLILPNSISTIGSGIAKYIGINYLKIPDNYSSDLDISNMYFLSDYSLAGIAKDLADLTNLTTKQLKVNSVTRYKLYKLYVDNDFNIVSSDNIAATPIINKIISKKWSITQSQATATYFNNFGNPILRGFNK